MNRETERVMAWVAFARAELLGVFVDDRTGELRRSGPEGYGSFEEAGASELLGRVRRVLDSRGEFEAYAPDGLPMVSGNGAPKHFGSVVEAAKAVVDYLPYQPS